MEHTQKTQNYSNLSFKSSILGLLLLKAIILGLLIVYGGIGLSPDEAQYWTWSQDLDWGYYSKPPGIAWQIALTTSLFGNNEFGVRFGALLIGFFLALTLYSIGRSTGAHPFWSAVVLAFSPLGVYLSLVATTDGGAIFFLTLAVAVLVQKKGPNYVLIGGCIALGALFKWTAFVFWPVLLIAFFFFKPLRKKSVILGFLLSLLALIPTLYWNCGHDWATFRHVSKTAQGGAHGNFIDFLFAQVGLLSPLFFLLLLLAYCYLPKSKNWQVKLLGLFPLFVLLYLGFSLFNKMQPNWAAYLYPPAFALIPWVALHHLKGGRLWLHLATWLSVFMVTVMLVIPLGQTMGFLPLPYKLNPFRQCVGWEKLHGALTQAGYVPNRDFLFGDKYQTASLLSFYTPEQKRGYFFNLSQVRKNQFSYWPQMDKQEKGKTGYFVVLENKDESAAPWYEKHYKARLAPHFEEVLFKGAYPLYSVNGKTVKTAFIFEARGYLGSSPPQPEEY